MFDDKAKTGEELPPEKRYMAFEPQSFNSFFDFLVMLRWTWALALSITTLVFYLTTWAWALIGGFVLVALLYVLYKLVYKPAENSLNEQKHKFQKLNDSIFGY